jgi:hypothetical protein
MVAIQNKQFNLKILNIQEFQLLLPLIVSMPLTGSSSYREMQTQWIPQISISQL